MGGTQNVSFLGRRYFKLPILSCPRIPPATQANSANAFVSPGVNSRGELVPSHGASRRRLGDYSTRLKTTKRIII